MTILLSFEEEIFVISVKSWNSHT